MGLRLERRHHQEAGLRGTGLNCPLGGRLANRASMSYQHGTSQHLPPKCQLAHLWANAAEPRPGSPKRPVGPIAANPVSRSQPSPQLLDRNFPIPAPLIRAFPNFRLIIQTISGYSW
jgi:hypothetical protein